MSLFGLSGRDLWSLRGGRTLTLRVDGQKPTRQRLNIWKPGNEFSTKETPFLVTLENIVSMVSYLLLLPTEMSTIPTVLFRSGPVKSRGTLRCEMTVTGSESKVRSLTDCGLRTFSVNNLKSGGDVRDLSTELTLYYLRGFLRIIPFFIVYPDNDPQWWRFS